MLTRLAAIVLAGSVAALAVVRAVDLVGHFFPGRHADDEVVAEAISREVSKEVSEAVSEAVEEVEAAPEVAGTYIFDESGDALGKFPWSAHAELELRPEGRYELRIRTNLENEMEEETSWGRYRQKGDRLILFSAGDSDEHVFSIDGNRLNFEADWKARIALKAVGVTKTYMERQPE